MAALAACRMGVAGDADRLDRSPDAPSAFSPATTISTMLATTSEGGFEVTPLFTVGEGFDGYVPPGVPDGLVVFPSDADTIRVYMNHELPARAGVPYELANGTRLKGARISWFEIDRRSRRVTAAGPAIATIRDRAGRIVTAPRQVHERDEEDGRGLQALCSASGYRAGERGFADDILLTHEEASVRTGHAHGGSVWALDLRSHTLWALPDLGRGAWENSVAVPTADGGNSDGHVALLLADDYQHGRVPLYLWLGRKQPGGDFPARNGLREGGLYAWVADSGDRNPEEWSGSGTRRQGRFVPVPVREARNAGKPGYDADGYLDDTTLRARASARGVFLFSRPEDLEADPADPRRVVFASTGQGDAFPSDDWGSLYLIELRLPDDPGAVLQGGAVARADIALLYDADETGDMGLRNPDNVAWAVDGHIYVQEDKAVRRGGFGTQSGVEASVWRLHPDRPAGAQRIAVVDRGALPPGSSDPRADVAGAWESSGILDVSTALGTWPRAVALIATVQAHSVRDGPVGGRDGLVEGGQLLLLTRPAADDALKMRAP